MCSSNSIVATLFIISGWEKLNFEMMDSDRLLLSTNNISKRAALMAGRREVVLSALFTHTVLDDYTDTHTHNMDDEIKSTTKIQDF